MVLGSGFIGKQSTTHCSHQCSYADEQTHNTATTVLRITENCKLSVFMDQRVYEQNTDQIFLVEIQIRDKVIFKKLIHKISTFLHYTVEKRTN